MLPKKRRYWLRLLGVLLANSIVLCAQADDLARDPFYIEKDITKWKTYSDRKYGYEIKYPNNLEFRLAGIEAKRDGSKFVISSLAIQTHNGLYIEIYPGATLLQTLHKKYTPLMRTTEIKKLDSNFMSDSRDITFGQLKGRLQEMPCCTQCKEKECFVFVADGFYVWFVSPAGDFNKDIALKIISTFRFTK